MCLDAPAGISAGKSAQGDHNDSHKEAEEKSAHRKPPCEAIVNPATAGC